MYLVILRQDWPNLYHGGPWPLNRDAIEKFQNSLYACDVETSDILFKRDDNPHIQVSKGWLNSKGSETASIPRSGIAKIIKIGE